MIAKIDVAQLRVHLMAYLEELWCQEDIWSRELAELYTSQEVILADLEKIYFEIEGSQTVIFWACETIAKA